ncbi:SPFH domain-containing protein [bacterium]|nr:SPFH domain-containing protein [bacterium]
MRRIRTFFLCLLVVFLVGCHKVESRRIGVRFWKLPTYLGGGLSERVYRSGEVVIDYPIVTDLYRIDVGLRDVAFRAAEGTALRTRALDGNELTLEITLTYQLSHQPEKLLKLIQEVGRTNEEIESIVRSVARADIRTYMNELRTSEFIDSTSSYGALAKVQEKLNERLGPFGLEFQQLKLDSYRFDDEYEELLKRIQQFEEDVKRERERRLVIEREIERDKERAEGVKNALLKEAGGYRERRARDGENYLREKQNEAKSIRAVAEAEATALRQKVAALSGPGGDALVKLELAKQLLAKNPRFIVMNGGGSGEDQLTVNRLDANRLLEQAKIFEALVPSSPSSSGPRQPAPGAESRTPSQEKTPSESATEDGARPE